MSEPQKPFNPESESVRELQKNLYSKQAKLKAYERRRFAHKDVDVQTSWKDDQPAQEKKEDVQPREPMTVFTKLLIGAFMFFAFSVVAAGMVFYMGQNQVTYEEVELSVLGPNSAAGGETLIYDVNVLNENDVVLEIVDINITYPRGTVAATDGLSMTQDRATIDNLPAGSIGSHKFKAVLFGREGEAKDIKISVQYKPKGSERVIYKERIYQVQIESAPVVVEVEHDKSYLSGEQVALVVTARSNALKAISNLMLQVDYPFGFEYASSSQPAISYDNTFDIGILRPGQDHIVTIYGTIVGQDEEHRSFRYTLGTRHAEAEGEIGSVFTVADSLITIAKPAITLAVKTNGQDQSPYLAAPDQTVNLSLAYANNLPSKIFDAKIVAQITGTAFDKKSIKTVGGFYNSTANTITWSHADLPELVEIAGGGSGSINLGFDLWPTQVLAGLLTNPEISVDFVMSGTAFDESGQEEQVAVETNTRAKVATDIALRAQALHSTGPLTNIGTLQPRAEKESSYTVHWQLYNSTNDIDDTVVVAKLPSGVRYRNAVVPENAALEYDERTREIRWNAGTVPAATGYTVGPREIYFSIGVLPSLNQVGKPLKFMEDIRVEGSDGFSGLKVSDTAGDLDSQLDNDPAYGTGMDLVGE